jgi:membrane protein implicated in regulation of membrane protease activity
MTAMDRMRRDGRRVWFARVCALVLALLLFLGWPAQTGAYAVLSHEAIIGKRPSNAPVRQEKSVFKSDG